MIGLRRRKKIEGWAVDVKESEMLGVSTTFKQRLADNNKLWLISLGAILILAVWLMITSSNNEIIPDDTLSAPARSLYNDSNHRNFTNWFVNDKSYGNSIVSAEFIGQNKFRIYVPGDTSADDIDYTSKMAARLIEHKLRERAVVQIYCKKANQATEQLLATTQWEQKSHGYVTRYVDTGNDR